MLRLIRELLYFKMPKRKTNINEAMDYLAKVIRKKATVFLVSDFIETNFKKSLSLLNKRNDVIAVPVRDPAEIALPNIGLIEFTDAETGELIVVDTSAKKFRDQYNKSTSKQSEELKSMFRSINVDSINISTDKPYIHDLVRFFHMRHRRR